MLIRRGLSRSVPTYKNALARFRCCNGFCDGNHCFFGGGGARCCVCVFIISLTPLLSAKNRWSEDSAANIVVPGHNLVL